MDKENKGRIIGIRMPDSLITDLDRETKMSLEFTSRSDLIRQVLAEYVAGMENLRRT